MSIYINVYTLCSIILTMLCIYVSEGQCGEGWPSAAEHPEGDRCAGGAVPGDVREHGESDHCAGGTHGTLDRDWVSLLDDDVDLGWFKHETLWFRSSKSGSWVGTIWPQDWSLIDDRLDGRLTIGFMLDVYLLHVYIYIIYIYIHWWYTYIYIY